MRYIVGNLETHIIGYKRVVFGFFYVKNIQRDGLGGTVVLADVRTISVNIHESSTPCPTIIIDIVGHHSLALGGMGLIVSLDLDNVQEFSNVMVPPKPS